MKINKLHELQLQLRQIFTVKSGILGFGIRTTAQGIQNSTEDWIGIRNPSSAENEAGIQYLDPQSKIRNPSSSEKDLESSNWNPESSAWNPDLQECLAFPFMGRPVGLFGWTRCEENVLD